MICCPPLLPNLSFFFTKFLFQWLMTININLHQFQNLYISLWFFPLPFCSYFTNCNNLPVNSTSLIALESNPPPILFLRSSSFLTWCSTYLFSLSPFSVPLFLLLLPSFFLYRLPVSSYPCLAKIFQCVLILFMQALPWRPSLSVSLSLWLISFLQNKVKEMYRSM